VSTSSQQSGLKRFCVPSTVIKYDRLRRLSTHALRLILIVGYRSSRTQQVQVKFNFTELRVELDLLAHEVRRAAKELRSFGIVDFVVEDRILHFTLRNPDATIPDTYLRETQLKQN
jgi:hypothetical protein